MKSKLRGVDASDASAFLAAIHKADLMVVNGAGILTDAFLDNALGILATLGLAIRRGIPTAMFGQGIGPIGDPELRQRAKEVLPHVGLIGVREELQSLPLLESLGVLRSHVSVTGDDAVELGFRASRLVPARRPVPAIGVNLRVAPYADVSRELIGVLRTAFEAATRTHRARMLPVPIARHGGKMDIETLRELLPGSPDEDGGASLDTPQRVIERIGECHMMVTGSYHGAVFALAQGIPVVALAKSPYYLSKMEGLAHQFGTGCEVVDLHGAPAELTARVQAAIDRAWRDAGRIRGQLRAAAVDQIERGRATYRRLRYSIEGPPDRRSASRMATFPRRSTAF
jgi:colanic acid/amylovoran biosynthesis protein